jgi:hypothetical protein
MRKLFVLGIALGWTTVMHYVYWQFQLRDVAFYALLLLPLAAFGLWSWVASYVKPKLTQPRRLSPTGSIWRFLNEEDGYSLPTTAPVCPNAIITQTGAAPVSSQAAIQAGGQQAAGPQSAPTQGSQAAPSAKAAVALSTGGKSVSFLDDPLSWLSGIESRVGAKINTFSRH